jgi:hypothetical protein
MPFRELKEYRKTINNEQIQLWERCQGPFTHKPYLVTVKTSGIETEYVEFDDFDTALTSYELWILDRDRPTQL